MSMLTDSVFSFDRGNGNVSVWNRNLSTQEIQELFNGGFGVEFCNICTGVKKDENHDRDYHVAVDFV